MHVNCYYQISFCLFQAITKLNMDNNYSAILQERRNTLHLNNLYVIRRCIQVAILFKILTCQPTWYIREVYSSLPERPEIVRFFSTIDIAQSYFRGVWVNIRFRLRLPGLPSTVAIGGFASAKQCHLKTGTIYNIIFFAQNVMNHHNYFII